MSVKVALQISLVLVSYITIAASSDPKKTIIAKETSEVVRKLIDYKEHGPEWHSEGKGDLLLKVQNYVRPGTELQNPPDCLQRIMIAEKDWKNVPMKTEWTPRDDLLATCEGGDNFVFYRKNVFSYADVIHSYGHDRLIVVLEDRRCEEWQYSNGVKVPKVLDEEKCREKLIHAYRWSGTLRRKLFSVFGYST